MTLEDLDDAVRSEPPPPGTIRHVEGNRYEEFVTGWETQFFACTVSGADNLADAAVEIAAMKRELAVGAPVTVQATDIKAEATRRILAIAPEWRQRNMIARGLQLARREAAGLLTTKERAEGDAIEAVWAQINAIRSRSDALEKMLPQDFTEDRHWPEGGRS